MENSNRKGHWTGIFTKKNGNTEIDFTEEVTTKKVIMKPFVKSYLKKQQELSWQVWSATSSANS